MRDSADSTATGSVTRATNPHNITGRSFVTEVSFEGNLANAYRSALGSKPLFISSATVSERTLPPDFPSQSANVCPCVDRLNSSGRNVITAKLSPGIKVPCDARALSRNVFELQRPAIATVPTAAASRNKPSPQASHRERGAGADGIASPGSSTAAPTVECDRRRGRSRNNAMLNPTTNETANGSNTSTSASINHFTTSSAGASNARATNRYDPISTAAIWDFKR